MEKKNILFMIESLSLGGAEKSLVTLLQNLNYNKYEISLLLIKKEGVFNHEVPKNVKLIYQEMFSGISGLRLLEARMKFWFLRETQKNFNLAENFWKTFSAFIPNHNPQYDVAIAYSQGFATYFIADKVNAKQKYSWLNTDYIHARHNPSFDYDKYTQFNKIVCVSEECRISLNNAMRSIEKRLPTTVIKDITDKQVVLEMSKEDDGFNKDDKYITLLTVGRLAKEKSLHLAIEACKILKEKGIKLKWYIIGEGSERKKLEELIDAHKLYDEMFLMGYKKNPYAYVRTCDIYVQTSLFEGLGLTVIEAAILHKPIVTTNFPTASTIITHHKTGLICEMTPLAIANAIQDYIDNPDLRCKVVDNLKSVNNNDKEISLRKVNSLLQES